MLQTQTQTLTLVGKFSYQFDQFSIIFLRNINKKNINIKKMNKNVVIKKKLQQCHSENNIKKRVELNYLSSNFIYYTKYTIL